MPCATREDQRAAQKRWRERNKERHADQTARAKLMHKYGITMDDFDAMLEAQDGRCAICPATRPGGRGAWHVDHCHDTGIVRGLLCSNCNRGMGLLGDDPATLRAAADYLERPRPTDPRHSD